MNNEPFRRLVALHLLRLAKAFALSAAITLTLISLSAAFVTFDLAMLHPGHWHAGVRLVTALIAVMGGVILFVYAFMPDEDDIKRIKTTDYKSPKTTTLKKESP